MFKDMRGLRAGLAVALVSLACARCGRAAERTLSRNDELNTTSFNTGLNWDDGQAPTAGNTYVVPGGRTLRTPTSGNHTFAGDQLTISGSATPAPMAPRGAARSMWTIPASPGAARSPCCTAAAAPA